MKKFSFSLAAKFSAALLLAACVSFTSCKPQVDPEEEPGIDMSTVVNIEEDNPLNTSWVSTYYENFYISSVDDIFYTDGYEGNTLKIRKIDNKSGYIYFKYTAVPDYSKGPDEEPEDQTDWMYVWGDWYPVNTSLVGKWYAVYYSDLVVPEEGVKTVKLSGAYKENGKKACKTLEEAVNEFTVENGYFTGSSECEESLPC